MRIFLTSFFLFFLLSCSNYELSFHNQKGKNLNDLEGKWTVINYWAYWCPPCIKEIPELHNLDKNHEDIQVFLFNFDRLKGEELNEQMVRFNITLPALITNPQDFYDIVIPEALPVSYLINPNLQLVETLNGPQTEMSFLEVIKNY